MIRKLFLNTFIFMMTLLLFTSVQAQSLTRNTLYVIENFSSNPFQLAAYEIQGNQLVLGEKTDIPRRAGGPVGLAVCRTLDRVFVSYEASGTVDVFFASDLRPFTTPQIALPGASNIAGIVIHSERCRVYAVDRNGTHVYVYDENANQVPAEEFDVRLGAYNVDVWGNKLYVTYATNDIDVYDLDTHALLDTYTMTDGGKMGLAVDGNDPNNFLIYTSHTSQTSGNTQGRTLTQYNVNTGEEKRLDLGRDGRGVAVNPARGLVYVGAGDNGDSTPSEVRAYDKDDFIPVSSPLTVVAPVESVPMTANRIDITDMESSDMVFHTAEPEKIPTLSEWGVIILIFLLGGYSLVRMRSHS